MSSTTLPCQGPPPRRGLVPHSGAVASGSQWDQAQCVWELLPFPLGPSTTPQVPEGQPAGGGLAQQFWAAAGGVGMGSVGDGGGGVAWGLHRQPPGTLQGLSEPPVMQCWGVPWLWGLSWGHSPHSWGLAVLMPLTCNAPRLGSRVGGSTHPCPGCPQPCTVAAQEAGASQPVLLHSPPGFPAPQGTLPWEGYPYPSCCVWFCCHHCFFSPWLGGGVSPSAGHPMELGGGGVNKADGKGRSLSLHGLASLLSSVRRLCGQASEGAPWTGPGTPHLPSAPLLGSDPSCP